MSYQINDAHTLVMLNQQLLKGGTHVPIPEMFPKNENRSAKAGSPERRAQLDKEFNNGDFSDFV